MLVLLEDPSSPDTLPGWLGGQSWWTSFLWFHTISQTLTMAFSSFLSPTSPPPHPSYWDLLPENGWRQTPCPTHPRLREEKSEAGGRSHF